MRREKTVTIDDRGQELKFIIREMPAMKLESWLIRAGLALAASGLADSLLTEQAKKEPMDAEGAIRAAGKLMRMDAQSLFTALGQLDYEKLEPLLNDLTACCQYVSGNILTRLEPGNIDGIISDVRTLFALQKEALKLNLDFFGNAVRSEPEKAEGRKNTSAPRISVR